MTKTACFLLLLSLPLAACGDGTPQGPQARGPSGIPSELLGVRWVMEGAIPGRGTIAAGIELQPDGTVVGHTGVNRATGTFEVSDGNGIRFSPLATTRMAGPPEAMEREQAFLGGLAKTDAWRIVDGKLELRAADEVVLTLAPTDKP